MNIDEAGAGACRCVVGFNDDSRMSYQVTVGVDGKWVTNSGD